MGTLELLIVFAAFMAVISLVAIAIDWIGRPLRSRRFIPRMYRYDDELVADPALFDIQSSPAIRRAEGAPVWAAAAAKSAATAASGAAVGGAAAGTALATRQPTAAGRRRSLAATPSRGAGSSFRNAVRSADPGDDPHRQIARTIPQAAAPSWHPGMPLDARVGDRKATVAVKAERYWKSAAAHLAQGGAGHFDARSRELMAQGKPPRRRNPRTGDVETMELVGLRAASNRADVRMRWPDDAVDPWSPS